jgi:hypothetical protein
MSEDQKTKIYAIWGMFLLFLAGYAHARIKSQDKSQEEKEKAFKAGWGMRGDIGAMQKKQERGEG